MGYDDYEKDGSGAEDTSSRTQAGVLGMVDDLMGLCVKVLGFVLILIGLGVGAAVVLEAWALYKAPERIERFAVAVEQGSNLDEVLRNVAQAADVEAAGEQGQAHVRPQGGLANSAGALRLSYFAAWAIVLVLMLVVGMLAMSAAATGAKLALAGMRPAGRR